MDYATPQVRRVSSVGWFRFSIVASLGMALAIVPPLVIGHFTQIFKDFKLELPWVTKVMINTPWPVWSGAMVMLVVIALCVQLTVEDRRVSGIVLGLILFLMMAFAVTTTIALFSPTITLIQGVSGDKKKG